MGEAAAQWVDRLFAGGSVVADSVSQGVFGCVTRVLGWMPQLLLFGLTALLSAYFLAGDAPRLRALAARHVPEEWRARGGQLLVRLRAALRGSAPGRCCCRGRPSPCCAGPAALPSA